MTRRRWVFWMMAAGLAATLVWWLAGAGARREAAAREAYLNSAPATAPGISGYLQDLPETTPDEDAMISACLDRDAGPVDQEACAGARAALLRAESKPRATP